jgi:dipeptidyl aminopeptidase/acylaminoacyl peptidase
MRLNYKSRRCLATLLVALVLAAVFGSQYVRQTSIEPGPFREWAVAVLALTDSAQDQWLTTIYIGVYFAVLTLLSWRLASRFDHPRSADLEIGSTAGSETRATKCFPARFRGLTSAITKATARLKLPIYGPEVLLLIFVSFAVVAYAFDYQKAYFFSDFLTLFAGVTFGRAVAMLRLWNKGGKGTGGDHAAVVLLLALLLALVAVFHPDMGRTYRYREHVRWMGPYFNPNTFGLLMGMGLILAAGQLLGASANIEHRTSNTEPRSVEPRLWHWSKIVFLATAAVVCGIGLVKSCSRGAWVGTFFGLAYLAYAAIPLFRTSPQPSPQGGEGELLSCGSWCKRGARPLIPGAALLVCSLLVLGFWNFRHTEHQVARRVFSVGNPNDFSWRNRVTASVGALQMMGDRPLLGFGWNQVERTYADAYQPRTLSESSAISLNDYFVLGATVGLPALLCLLGYIGWKFASGHRAYFCGEGMISLMDWQMAVCRAAFVVLLLGFAVEKGIFYIALGAPFWILLELGAALPVESKSPARHVAEQRNLSVETATAHHPDPLPARLGEGRLAPAVVAKPVPTKTLAAVGLVALMTCIWFFAFHRKASPQDPLYRQILAHFKSAQPMAMSVSPDGKYVLHKTDTGSGFQLTVVERETGREVASNFSRNTQRALNWRPDSQAIAFQDSPGLKRPLYLLDLKTGKTKALAAPVSQTALLPLRWSPNGKKLAYFHGDWTRGQLLVIDALKENEPIVVKDSLSANCDFVWSPDGSALAFTSEFEPSTITLTPLASLKPTRLTPQEGARIRELAWAPDGRSILATARGETDEYFKLLEVETNTGKSALRGEAIGDIENPLWLPDGGSFLYHVLSNGITIAVLGNRENPRLKTVGPTDGVVRITHVSPDGNKAFARFASLTAPPALQEIPLQEGEASVAYAPAKSDSVRCLEPEFITLKSSEETPIPAYHWNSVSLGRQRKAVLIVVHGGLHTQTYPTWEAYLKVMLDRGCDVIAVNFRGSSGYGQKFERMGGELERVQDVLAAKEYAIKTLKVAPKRVFLTGISHGAGLIATAAAQGEEFGGLILVSWVGPVIDSERRFQAPFKVVEIHGEVDPTMSPAKARETVESYFASTSGIPRVQFRVFEGEGHFFYKTASWAQVYWEALKMMELE